LPDRVPLPFALVLPLVLELLALELAVPPARVPPEPRRAPPLRARPGGGIRTIGSGDSSL
jgi:hypothetical protein